MIKNTRIFRLSEHADNYGHLVPIEAQKDVPFDIERIYYIYNVENGMRRGFHSHRDLQQALVCVHGSVRILVKTPYEEEIVLLNTPTRALYIGPMVWREMYDFTSDAVLLVLANRHYDVADYIRDYEVYAKEAERYFLEKGSNNKVST